jgi:hypothetical protein
MRLVNIDLHLMVKDQKDYLYLLSITSRMGKILHNN